MQCAFARRRRQGRRTTRRRNESKCRSLPRRADSDSNCRDFRLQGATMLALDSAPARITLKSPASQSLAPARPLLLTEGAGRETAVIATVGTPGGTIVRTATAIGATTVPVASTAGFSVGQPITIDDGANRETAAVASVSGNRRVLGAAQLLWLGLWRLRTRRMQWSAALVSPSPQRWPRRMRGKRRLSTAFPTPGAPNQYYARPQ